MWALRGMVAFQNLLPPALSLVLCKILKTLLKVGVMSSRVVIARCGCQRRCLHLLWWSVWVNFRVYMPFTGWTALGSQPGGRLRSHGVCQKTSADLMFSRGGLPNSLQFPGPYRTIRSASPISALAPFLLETWTSIHRKLLTLHLSELKMEATTTSKRCNHLRTKITSTVYHRERLISVTLLNVE